jgi:hypothetical protein
MMPAVVVIAALSQTGGAKAVSDNAALIGALVALGGVFIAQMVSIVLEAERAREAALQTYFKDVGKLLIEKPLRRASPNDNLSTVVRAQTLTVLERLRPDRKRYLLQFLYESDLINKDKLVVRLVMANLSNAYLRGGDLSGANPRLMIGLTLLRRYLRQSFLFGTDLIGANLPGVDLFEAMQVDTL